MRLTSLIKRLLTGTRGSTAITMAAAIIPTLAAVGASVDGGYAFMTRSQLSSAVDQAALTGARLYMADDRDEQARAYFDENFQVTGGEVEITKFEIEDVSEGDSQRVKVIAEAKVNTWFMRIFGMDTLPVSASAIAVRGANPVEMVLALDNTGSMTLSAGDKTRIEALRESTKALLGILYGTNPEDVDDPGKTIENLKIGIIPYTAFVNVGRHLVDEGTSRGVNYLKDMGSYDFDPASKWGWKGCVDADQTVNNIDKNTSITDDASFAQAWDTKDYTPGVAGNPLIVPQLHPSFEVTGEHVDNGTQCGGDWDEYKEGEFVKKHKADPNCKPTKGTGKIHKWSYDFRYNVPAGWPLNSKYPQPDPKWPDPEFYPNGSGMIVSGWRSPNMYCPAEALLPAVRTVGSLLNYADTELRAYDPAWGTYSNLGLLWAWRMLSPAPPFEGGATSSLQQKAIVLMTDGFLYASGGWDVRGPYGFPYEKRLTDDESNEQKMFEALEKRTARMCEEIKRQNITIYTITLALKTNDGRKDLYRECASSEELYFDAPDAEALKSAFQKVASDLTSIRLEK
jgi:Flp pilus assembly protein TadG